MYLQTLPLFFYSVSIGGYVSLENAKDLESTFNRSTLVGSPSFMGEYDFAFHYYYSVRSTSSEYSSSIMDLRTPTFVFPTSFAVGGKLKNGTFLQVGGEFWGNYRDYVGDYEGELLTLSMITQNSLLGEFGVDAFYTHFQRSAYIGSYSVDTGGVSTTVDFYEKWIYYDGFGLDFTHYGEDYNLKSGFAYLSSDNVVPLFVEFRKLLGSTTLSFRQTAFWGSTLLPPKLNVEVYREFVMGRRSLYLKAFTGILLRPSDVFNLRRPPITGVSLKYVSFYPTGELTVMGRGYATESDRNEVGGEIYVSYRFAKRWRPKPFVGFVLTGDRSGPYVGLGFGVLGRRFQVAYYHAHRSVSLGLEVSHGVFAL